MSNQKISAIFPVLLLGMAISVPSLTLVYTSQKNNIATAVDSHGNLNWKTIKNYFESNSSSYLYDVVAPGKAKSISNSNNKAMIKKANKESEKIIDRLSKKDKTWSQLNYDLQKNNAKYKTSLNKSTNEVINNSKIAVINDSNNSSLVTRFNKQIDNADKAKKWASNLVRKVTIARDSFAALAAVAGIAAAGFWAAAWFFGISVPWAIATTAAAAALGVATAGLNWFLYTKNPNTIINAVSWAFSVRQVASSFKEVVYPLLIANVTVAEATSWALPALFAVMDLSFAVYYWINYAIG